MAFNYIYIYNIYIYTSMYKQIAGHMPWGWLHAYYHIHDEQGKFEHNTISVLPSMDQVCIFSKLFVNPTLNDNFWTT